MPLLYRMMALVFLLAPMFVAPAGAQSPERRFALVVGNSEYKAGRHPTAANDAGSVQSGRHGSRQSPGRRARGPFVHHSHHRGQSRRTSGRRRRERALQWTVIRGQLKRVRFVLNHLFGVMAGLVPAIHVFSLRVRKKDVDARDKRGHDAEEVARFHRNAQ